MINFFFHDFMAKIMPVPLGYYINFLKTRITRLCFFEYLILLNRNPGTNDSARKCSKIMYQRKAFLLIYSHIREGYPFWVIEPDLVMIYVNSNKKSWVYMESY